MAEKRSIEIKEPEDVRGTNDDVAGAPEKKEKLEETVKPKEYDFGDEFNPYLEVLDEVLEEIKKPVVKRQQFIDNIRAVGSAVDRLCDQLGEHELYKTAVLYEFLVVINGWADKARAEYDFALFQPTAERAKRLVRQRTLTGLRRKLGIPELDKVPDTECSKDDDSDRFSCDSHTFLANGTEVNAHDYAKNRLQWAAISDAVFKGHFEQKPTTITGYDGKVIRFLDHVNEWDKELSVAITKALEKRA